MPNDFYSTFSPEDPFSQKSQKTKINLNRKAVILFLLIFGFIFLVITVYALVGRVGFNFGLPLAPAVIKSTKYPGLEINLKCSTHQDCFDQLTSIYYNDCPPLVIGPKGEHVDCWPQSVTDYQEHVYCSSSRCGIPKSTNEWVRACSSMKEEQNQNSCAHIGVSYLQSKEVKKAFKLCNSFYKDKDEAEQCRISACGYDIDSLYSQPDPSQMECIKKTISSSCSDSRKNGLETDIDCGNGCKPCENNKFCQKDDDCSSGICESNYPSRSKCYAICDNDVIGANLPCVCGQQNNGERIDFKDMKSGQPQYGQEFIKIYCCDNSIKYLTSAMDCSNKDNTFYLLELQRKPGVWKSEDYIPDNKMYLDILIYLGTAIGENKYQAPAMFFDSFAYRDFIWLGSADYNQTVIFANEIKKQWQEHFTVEIEKFSPNQPYSPGFAAEIDFSKLFGDLESSKGRIQSLLSEYNFYVRQIDWPKITMIRKYSFDYAHDTYKSKAEEARKLFQELISENTDLKIKVFEF